MSIDEMTTTLDRLGIEVININGDEIQGHCPGHLENTGKEDSNPSWYINADTGAHICFSCGFKGNLFSLVTYVQKIEFSGVAEWLGSGESNLQAMFNRITKPHEVFHEVEAITESMLAAFVDPPAEALKSRGLTSEAAQKYEVKWDVRQSNWITVIRDPYMHSLLGWQEKGSASRYFRNYPTGVQKSRTLFGGLQYESGDLIVVESPLDVVRLQSVGITGGVSTYGSSVSMAQINQIRYADRVIFAMDNDEAGRASSLALLELSKEMQFECWFFNYSETDQKDVGGMSKAEIEWGIENARHSLYGESAIKG